MSQGINALVALLREHGVWLPFTCLMNTLGTPGRFKPRPHRQWNAAETEAFLNREETQAVLTFLQMDDAALRLPLAHAEGQHSLLPSP
jgi:hypothetical protein